jgi:hypothetical protein
VLVEAGVAGGLSAAGLVAGEGYVATVVGEDADEGAADLGEEGIGQAGDEEGDAHAGQDVQGVTSAGKRGANDERGL